METNQINEIDKEAKAAFQNSNFKLAIDKFTILISLEPEDAKHILNRSSSYAKIHEYQLALLDAKTCIEKNQSFING